jgi:putative MATE family efflux protein
MLSDRYRRLQATLSGVFADREYFQRLVRFALPIALQSFATSLLNMVAGLMVGQLGDASIAAVALANQVFFLLNLVLFGITSGSAIFTAQLWGKGDVPNIRRVLAFSLLMGAVPGMVFFLLSQLAPEAVLSIYSEDPQVVALGAGYLRIFGWSFILVVITFSYSAVLRSTGNVMGPLVVSTAALGLNVLLSYCLVFGKIGFPELGVNGAAYANLVARILECIAMLALTYRFRLPAAVHLEDLLRLDWPFISTVLKPVLPVAFNELFWSLGITTYNVVYARIGTEAIAAMNIASTIDSLMFVFFIGIGNATAILVGNLIGAGEEHQAHQYAVRSLVIAVMLAVVIGGIIFMISPGVLSWYKVSDAVILNAQSVLTIISLLLWMRAWNMVMFIGVLRSGGDTRFAFLLDAVIIWVLGVPMAFLGAFVFHLPVYWVYLMVMSEEFSKMILSMRRLVSRKWIHNLAHSV